MDFADSLPDPLERALYQSKRLQRRALVTQAIAELAHAGVLGLVAILAWDIIRPDRPLEPFVFGAFVFAFALLGALLSRLRRVPISPENFLMALEIKHPEMKTNPFVGGHSKALEAWAPLFSAEIDEIKAFEARRLRSIAGQILVLLVLSAVGLLLAHPKFGTAASHIKGVFLDFFPRPVALKIIEGATDDQKVTDLVLSPTANTQIELLPQNLIEVSLNNPSETEQIPPVIELRRLSGAKAGTVFQAFQMNNGVSESGHVHRLAFAVSDDVELFIPSVSKRSPLAKILVKKPPVPAVELSMVSEAEDPWPDDKPVKLHIEIQAKNPLRLVRLAIYSSGRRSEELVNSIMTEDMLSLSTDYSLLLEPYMDRDIADVEIFAEAIDRALPVPLMGRSEPVTLKTVSAYGRYRQTLDSLRGFKKHLDDAVTQNRTTLPPEARELIQKAKKQSETSPFFDALDRANIARFEQNTVDLVHSGNRDALLDLSDRLNSFLFEHETLDDRERDRDFFVAARSISHLIEQQSISDNDVKNASKRMTDFLSDRHARWTLRVARLPNRSKPESWPRIKGKPFHHSIEKIDQLMTKSKTPKDRNEALTTLSQSVVNYRAWIEELEAKEDEYRADLEKERREGIASAREKLRELQKRQDQISRYLDHAPEQAQNALQAEWPSHRMHQNTNIKESRELEGLLRAFAPQAGQRIKAAGERMEATVESGNKGEFADAESSSDSAARLLRLADQSAKEQEQGGSRGRRRRVTGNNYYGQTVVGGDIEIKREYEVDKRYREDILDEVRHSRFKEDNRNLLDDYVRQIIR